MFVRSTVAAIALAAALAAPAAAQTLSPGAIQLARLAGVEPGAYTLGQLTRLRTAQRERDTTMINRILGAPGHRQM